MTRPAIATRTRRGASRVKAAPTRLSPPTTWTVFRLSAERPSRGTRSAEFARVDGDTTGRRAASRALLGRVGPDIDARVMPNIWWLMRMAATLVGDGAARRQKAWGHRVARTF